MPDPDTLEDIKAAQEELIEAQRRLERGFGLISDALGLIIADTIEPMAGSNRPLWARQSLAKAACEVSGETYAAEPARRSEFRRFHNGLRILMNIDARDFPGPADEWPRFRKEPWLYFITCEEPVARSLWAIIQRRHPQVTETVVGIAKRAETQS
jgi:hypothetical protein